MSTTLKISNLAVLIAALCTGHVAFAQSSIILNTSPTTTEIELEPGTDVEIDPLSGNLFATPDDPAACSATVSCEDVEVDILSFNSPLTVPQGQSVNFTWSSRGAWSCSGSGFADTNWNGTGKQPSGSQLVSTVDVPLDTYDVVLDCSNGPVNDQLTRSITVEENNNGGGGGPEFCAQQGRLPPPGLTRDIDALSNAFNQDIPGQTLVWEDLFNAPFPDGGTNFWKSERDKYISLEFTTTGVPTGTIGSLDLRNPQGAGNFGLTLLTISQCPGDFTNQSDPNCKDLVNNGDIRFAVGLNPGFTCELEPNTTYYLNALHTTDANAPYDWECAVPPFPPTSTLNCRDLIQVIEE